MKFLILIVITILLCELCSVDGISRKRAEQISAKKCQKYKDLRAVISNVGMRIPWNRARKIRKHYDCSMFVGMIYGGREVRAGEFPHMAALGRRNADGTVQFNCGGSLISERFILTAAHCIVDPMPTFVRLGDHDFSKYDVKSHPVDYIIEDIITHDDYSPFKRTNDIALLKLTRSVVFNNYTRPACLNTKDEVSGNVTATGWGKTRQFKSGSDIMMKVNLPLVGNKACSTKWGTNILDGQICAGGVKGQDTCQGDSGAPIQVGHNDAQCVFDLVGVTSYGNPRCGREVPSIYNRVSHYLEWIVEKAEWDD